MPGWDLEREPDLVYQLPEPQHIPEQGTLDYRYIYVRTDHDRDLWVTAAEARPGAVEHVHQSMVVAERLFEQGGRILGFLPHMHLRGKAFRYELLRTDGTEEVLLDVPRYDFNWQLYYDAWEPVRIEPGDRIRATAWYDNSEANPANPDPSVAVRWGDQSWEEMMIGFFEWVREPSPAPEAAASANGPSR